MSSDRAPNHTPPTAYATAPTASQLWYVLPTWGLLPIRHLFPCLRPTQPWSTTKPLLALLRPLTAPASVRVHYFYGRENRSPIGLISIITRTTGRRSELGRLEGGTFSSPPSERRRGYQPKLPHSDGLAFSPRLSFVSSRGPRNGPTVASDWCTSEPDLTHPQHHHMPPPRHKAALSQGDHTTVCNALRTD